MERPETDVFAKDFEPVDFETWRARVKKDLKGKPLEALAQEIADGVRSEVLYEEGSGSGPAVGRSGHYVIEQEYAQPGPARAAQAIVEDVARGSQAAWVRVGENLQCGHPVSTSDGVGVGLDRRPAMRRLLRDLDPASVRLSFECGAAALPVAAMLEQIVEGRAPGSFSSLRGAVLADPWAPLARRGTLALGESAALDDLAQHVASLAERAPALRSLGVSVVGYHDAGADAVDELAAALATTIQYLRALEARGVDPELGLAGLTLRVAVGSDVTAEIAKLRALRVCLGRIAGACSSEAQPYVHARGSWRERSTTDPWVNLLRGTAESFAALVGGADGGCTTALDAANGPPSAFARRLAFNTQVLLVEESHLAQVFDPAGGSGAIEEMTDALARAAWAKMQSIEASGGMLASLRSGTFVEGLAARAKARAELLSSGKTTRIAVNRFPPMVERELPSEPQREEPAAVRLGAPEDAQAVSARLGALASQVGARRVAAIAAAVEAGASADRILGARADDDGALSVRALEQVRLSEPYEALRARVQALPASRRRVSLVALGSLASHKARVDGLRERLGSVALVLEEGESPVAALVGSDDALEAEGAQALTGVSDSARVIVTGTAKRHGDALGDRPIYWGDVDDVLALYTDLVSVLEAAQ